MDVKECALWVIDVDRRLITIKAFKKEKILHPSDIAKDNKRSIQNISRAVHELETQSILKPIDKKVTWRKYILTDKGKKVLDEIEKFYS
jgi:predicted transcriptional regulator